MKLKLEQEKAPYRALLKSLGLQDDDMSKPFIGVAKTATQTSSPNISTSARLAKKAVKEGILAAGIIPFEFSTIAVVDGVAMGT